MTRITAREVLDYWCEARAVSRDSIMAGDRRRHIARERHLLMYAIRRLCPHMSLPMIGEFLRGMDHTSVLHGIRQVEKRLMAGDLEAIEAISDVRAAFHDKYRSLVSVKALEARIELLDHSIHAHTEALNDLLAKRQEAHKDLVELRCGVAAMEEAA